MTKKVGIKKNTETLYISRKIVTSPSVPAATREHASPSSTSPQSPHRITSATNSKHMRKLKKNSSYEHGKYIAQKYPNTRKNNKYQRESLLKKR
jgi:hypothetical protein